MLTFLGRVYVHLKLIKHCLRHFNYMVVKYIQYIPPKEVSVWSKAYVTPKCLLISLDFILNI